MAKRKPGKYDKVLPGLPVLPPEDLDRQQRIEKIKESIGTRDAVQMAGNYVTLRALKDEMEEQLSEVQIQIDAFEQLLAESEEAGSAGWGDYGAQDNALRLPNGDVIRVQPEPVGKVEDKEAYRLWCIENGYETKLQLWPSTTNSIIKERVLHGLPEPDGCKCYSYKKVKLTKGDRE